MPSRLPAAELVCRTSGGALLLLLLVGCGETPGIAPVSGVVLLDNQPLGGATVTFQPDRDSLGGEKFSGSVGKTDQEGRFTLRLIEPNMPGAAVGRHIVTITTVKSGPSDAIPPRGERVPLTWRNGSQTYDVPAKGDLEVRFELRSR